MTQKDKELLLKDLCARLPYGVVCDIYNEECTIKEKLQFGGITRFANDTIAVRPYLRPTSSMTEEEKHELLKFGVVNLDKDNNAIDVCCVGFEYHAKVQDYLNSIHIDYRGLIERGLAIEVTEDNNPYKE